MEARGSGLAGDVRGQQTARTRRGVQVERRSWHGARCSHRVNACVPGDAFGENPAGFLHRLPESMLPREPSQPCSCGANDEGTTHSRERVCHAPPGARRKAHVLGLRVRANQSRPTRHDGLRSHTSMGTHTGTRPRVRLTQGTFSVLE
jgi:hypothetical protein